MRIYIMTDIEGVAGVLDGAGWCLSDGRYYELGKELLTREVNAAIEGFMSAGAKEFLVADGHGPGGINPVLLHSAAELLHGFPKSAEHPFIDGHFDCAAWIGQHPKAGTVGGHLCHTGSSHVRDVSVNGISIGEFGQHVLCASELGIRAIFASGCRAFTEEAQALVPGIETVAVKRGLQTDPGHHLPFTAYRTHNIAAIHLQPEEARRRIREGARQALLRAGRESFGLVSMKPPYQLVRILRSTDTEPPRICRASHETSVIALFKSAVTTEPLKSADPLTLVEREPINV